MKPKTPEQLGQQAKESLGESVQAVKEKRLIADYWPTMTEFLDSLGVDKVPATACQVFVAHQVVWINIVNRYDSVDFDREKWNYFLKKSSKIEIAKMYEEVEAIIKKHEEEEANERVSETGEDVAGQV
jgi:hypothetical protein